MPPHPADDRTRQHLGEDGFCFVKSEEKRLRNWVCVRWSMPTRGGTFPRRSAGCPSWQRSNLFGSRNPRLQTTYWDTLLFLRSDRCLVFAGFTSVSGVFIYECFLSSNMLPLQALAPLGIGVATGEQVRFWVRSCAGALTDRLGL